jgi:NAD(P)-dependent dehydrogenase (short-subunit alcohol dehydrogenase family)
MFDINVLGSMLCAREAILEMSTRHGGVGGSIVNLSSAAARLGSPSQYLDYAAAKGAIDSFTLGLAKEVAGEGIRVNAVAPGPFPTESAWEKLAPIPKANVGAASADKVPMGRFGRMEELNQLLMFLQADGCDYLTGVTIAIDGGHHLAAPSTFAELGQLTPEDWAQAKTVVRARAEQEKEQRSQ